MRRRPEPIGRERGSCGVGRMSRIGIADRQDGMLANSWITGMDKRRWVGKPRSIRAPWPRALSRRRAPRHESLGARARFVHKLGGDRGSPRPRCARGPPDRHAPLRAGTSSFLDGAHHRLRDAGGFLKRILEHIGEPTAPPDLPAVRATGRRTSNRAKAPKTLI